MILCTNHQVRVHACVERGVTPADRHPGLPQVAGSLLDGARLRWFRPKSCGQQSRAVGPAHEAPDPTAPRTSLRAKGSADPVEFAHRQRIRAFEDSVHRACSIAILAPRATPAATRRKPAANIDPRRRGCALSRLGGSTYAASRDYHRSTQTTQEGTHGVDVDTPAQPVRPERQIRLKSSPLDSLAIGPRSAQKQSSGCANSPPGSRHSRVAIR